MLKTLIGTVAAGMIAAGVLSFAAPAQAAEFGVYVNPGYQHSCRHWSERPQAWVFTCNRPYYDQYYNQGPSFGFEFGDRGHHRDFERR